MDLCGKFVPTPAHVTTHGACKGPFQFGCTIVVLSLHNSYFTMCYYILPSWWDSHCELCCPEELWTAFEPVFPPSDESVRPTKGDIAQLDCSPDERVRPDLRDARGNAALPDCSPPDLGVATWLGQTPFPSPFPSEKIQQGRLLQLQLQLLINEENHLIFFSLQRFFENLTAWRFTRQERGMAGTDPSKRGRSPVVLEVRFRSRAQTNAEIQSEIVLGYLHYLGFCTVW